VLKERNEANSYIFCNSKLAKKLGVVQRNIPSTFFNGFFVSKVLLFFVKKAQATNYSL